MKKFLPAVAVALLVGGVAYYFLAPGPSTHGTTSLAVQAQEGLSAKQQESLDRFEEATNELREVRKEGAAAAKKFEEDLEQLRQTNRAAGITPEEPDTSLVEEMSLGNPDAPVTVIEYASFTCPHCANFHEGPFKQLKADYIDPGKINFIYREVYFDRPGLWAGMVARCGGAMRYFGIADLIYDQQDEWTKGAPAEIAQNLRKIGKTAGLSDDQLDACLSDADKAQAMVALYEKNASADKITATPSFVIDGETMRNMSYEDMRKVLDEKLAE